MRRAIRHTLRRSLPAALQHWRRFGRSGRLYLVHAALLTGSLAIYGLFFNLAVESFGYDRPFIGTLNQLSIGVAAVLSVPLWWLVTRIGLRPALILSAVLQVVSAALVAWVPTTAALLVATALTGISATLFQVSAPPFMMEQSDAETRDHMFSANAAINVGLAGVATFFAGQLKAGLAGILGVGAETAPAYRAAFAAAAVGLVVAIVPLLLIRRQAEPAQPLPERPEPTAATRQQMPELTADPPGRVFWLTKVPLLRGLVARLPTSVRPLVEQPATVLPLLVSPLLVSFGAALLIVYLNLFFKDRFAVSDIVLGRIFAAIGITTGLAALAGPFVSTRIGKARTIVLAQLLSIPFLLIMGFVPVLALAVTGALLRGALFNISAPLYDAFAMERTAERARPIVIGLINGAYTVGYLVAPLISTRVQAEMGFSPLFVATALFYAAAALANYVLFVRGRRHLAEAATAV